MGINLRGGNIGMSQHFLNGTQIGTVGKQMGGKGMAQYMRCNVRCNTGLLPVLLDNLPESLPGKPFAAFIQKQNIGLPAVHHIRPAGINIAVQRIQRILPQRNHPFFGAFAEAAHISHLKAYIGKAQINQLAYSKP